MWSSLEDYNLSRISRRNPTPRMCIPPPPHNPTLTVQHSTMQGSLDTLACSRVCSSLGLSFPSECVRSPNRSPAVSRSFHRLAGGSSLSSENQPDGRHVQRFIQFQVIRWQIRIAALDPTFSVHRPVFERYRRSNICFFSRQNRSRLDRHQCYESLPFS